jgi:hypothetical protein
MKRKTRMKKEAMMKTGRRSRSRRMMRRKARIGQKSRIDMKASDHHGRQLLAQNLQTVQMVSCPRRLCPSNELLTKFIAQSLLRFSVPLPSGGDATQMRRSPTRLSFAPNFHANKTTFPESG